MSTALDADAFTTAFTRHGRALWVLAAAWVGRSEADDLVQETARVAWQQRHRFAPGSDVRAWLSQIARHTGANWRRRQRPEAHDPASLREPHARVESPPTWPFDAAQHGLSDELTRALQSLPETARACLLLHVVVELTAAEIGTMLELPENTVGSHIRRARLAMRASLSPTMPLPETP